MRLTPSVLLTAVALSSTRVAAQQPAPQVYQEMSLHVVHLQHANSDRVGAALQQFMLDLSSGSWTIKIGDTLTIAAKRVPVDSGLLAASRVIRIDTAASVMTNAKVIAAVYRAARRAVRIIPDMTTNSLLIRATPADFAIINRLVMQVDQ